METTLVLSWDQVMDMMIPLAGTPHTAEDYLTTTSGTVEKVIEPCVEHCAQKHSRSRKFQQDWNAKRHGKDWDKGKTERSPFRKHRHDFYWANDCYKEGWERTITLKYEVVEKEDTPDPVPEWLFPEWGWLNSKGVAGDADTATHMARFDVKLELARIAKLKQQIRLLQNELAEAEKEVQYSRDCGYEASKVKWRAEQPENYAPTLYQLINKKDKDKLGMLRLRLECEEDGLIQID